MTFTGAALTELKKYNKAVQGTLNLRNLFSGSDSWLAFNYQNQTYKHQEDNPAEMSFDLLNTDLTFAQIRHLTSGLRTHTRAFAQFIVTIGSETETFFDGFLKKITPRDYGFKIEMKDWSELRNETDCDVFLEPDALTIVAENAATAILVQQIGTTLGASYGFVIGTTPAAFSATSARRTWAATNIRVYDGATVSSAEELNPKQFSIDYTSGALKILIDSPAASYYVTGVDVYKETAAGTNVDVMRLYEQAWATALVITDVSTGSNWFKVDGDVSSAAGIFNIGDIFEVQNSTGNDNEYTVITATYAGGPDETTITVASVTDATVDGSIVHENDYLSPRLTIAQMDLVDSGVDIDRAFRFRGKVADLEKKIRSSIGTFIKSEWNSVDQKYKARLVVQLSKAITTASSAGNYFEVLGDFTTYYATGRKFRVANSTANDGSYVSTGATLIGGTHTRVTVASVTDATTDGVLTFTDNDLIHPVSVSQARDDRDLLTCVVVKGKKTIPLNFATPANTTDQVSRVSGTGNYFEWDGVNVGANDTFANIKGFMFDGDANKGAGVHNLDPTETNTPGSDYSTAGSKYSQSYNFVKATLDDVFEVQKIRLRMPGSRNINAAAGAQTILTGGDAVSFWPGVIILGSIDDATWKVMSPLMYGRFEPGSEVTASGDELVRPKVKYIYVLCQAYKHGFENQDDPGIGLGELEIYVDIEYELVRRISGFDASHSYEYTDGRNFPAYYPDFFTRMGLRHKKKTIDLGNEYDEHLANDIALNALGESMRNYQNLSWNTICDPRVKLYQSCQADDYVNGVQEGFLVRQVAMKNLQSSFQGNDYFAGIVEPG